VLNKSSFNGVTRFDLAQALPQKWRYWTTAYSVDGMMVDTGCAHTAQQLVDALGNKSLTLVVNTHTHEDHIGANGDLQARYSDMRIVAHPLALPVLARPRELQPLQPYRKIFWGWPKPSIAEAAPDGLMLETKNHRFQVIYTPGHGLDHICLYEPEHGWLFTGDLFVGGKERALVDGSDIWQIIASLKRIAGLPARCLFPGSAQVRENPRDEIGSKINYLEDLGGRILDLHCRGWGIKAIMRSVCGRPMQVEFITLGHFSRMHLILSYLGLNNN